MQQHGALRDGRDRRRPGRARGRLPPAATGPVVRDPRRATSASATAGAARWDSLRLYSPAFRDGLPGHAVPRAARRRTRRKDEMADYLETYAARFELPVRSGIAGRRARRTEDGRYVATAGDRRFEADNVVIATGVFQKPHIPEFAGELDPSITQLHSTRLPEPVAAPGGAGARRRREPLGLRHRVRGRVEARRRPLGPGHRTASRADREPPRTRCLFRGALLRRHACPDRRHASGKKDAHAHPARRRAAPPLPAEESASSRRRARARADCRRRGRAAGARRRARTRGQERRLVHRVPAGLLLDPRSRSRSATTASRSSTEASSRRRRACTSSGCRSCIRSPRCSSAGRAGMQSASRGTSSRSGVPHRRQRSSPLSRGESRTELGLVTFPLDDVVLVWNGLIEQPAPPSPAEPRGPGVGSRR